MMRADSASYAPGISTSRLPAMIALNFFRTLMMRTPPLSAAVPRGLYPRLRRRSALFPVHDVVHVLKRHPDVVEPFEQAHAVGGRNFKSNVGTARPADALGFEVDGERSRAIDGNDARDESVCGVRRKHDRQHAILQTVLAIDVSKTAGYDGANIVCDHAPYCRFAR